MTEDGSRDYRGWTIERKTSKSTGRVRYFRVSPNGVRFGGYDQEKTAMRQIDQYEDARGKYK